MAAIKKVLVDVVDGPGEMRFLVTGLIGGEPVSFAIDCPNGKVVYSARIDGIPEVGDRVNWTLKGRLAFRKPGSWIEFTGTYNPIKRVGEFVLSLDEGLQLFDCGHIGPLGRICSECGFNTKDNN